MDISREYRQLLWRMLRDGRFEKDPEHRMRIADFLTCWDNWARSWEEQSAALDWAMKYWWLGVIPSIIVFIYAASIMEKDVRQQYKWLMIAGNALDKSRVPLSVEERAAIGAMREEVQKVSP